MELVFGVRLHTQLSRLTATGTIDSPNPLSSAGGGLMVDSFPTLVERGVRLVAHLYATGPPGCQVESCCLSNWSPKSIHK